VIAESALVDCQNGILVLVSFRAEVHAGRP
jgi:hypothetical protein